MAEWPNASVLKTDVGFPPTVGSNPTSSEALRGGVKKIAVPLIDIGKSGRVAECVCLENRCRVSPDRRFESYLFRSTAYRMPQDLQTEVAHCVVASEEGFFAIRPPRHSFRIARWHTALLRRLEQSSSPLCLRLFRSQLICPSGRRHILSCILAVREASPHDSFNEGRMQRCLNRCWPEASLVPCSFFSLQRPQGPITTYYVEIEKKELSPFSTEELSTFAAKLEYELQVSISQGNSNTALLESEEDSLRTILLLAQQIKRIRDVPQVVLHYRGQSEETIDFLVTLVRVIKKGQETPFTMTKFPEIKRLIPLQTSIVGNLRNNYQKQAISLIAQCDKTPFLRYSHSLDLVRARQTVMRSIESSQGAVRDANGGLFFQHHPLVDELLPLLTDEERQEGYSIEALFHSLTPCIAKNMVSKEHMLTVFRHFRELRRCAKPGCLAERHPSVAFVSFLCPPHTSPEEILLLKPYLHIPHHCLAVCHIAFSHHRFGFAICFSADHSIQERFIESAQRMVNDKRQLSSPPSTVRFSLSVPYLSLDPRQSTDPCSGSLIKMLYEGLTRTCSDAAISNGIAEDIALSDDGCVYTFTLRPCTWTNGTPVTAHDFVYAWKKALLPTCATPYSYLFFPIRNGRAIKNNAASPDMLGVQALSDRVLRVTLEAPCKEFLLLCSHWIYSPLCHSIDEHRAGWNLFPDFRIPTNGPFRIRTTSSQHSLILERNPLFWNTSSAAPQTITFQLNSKPRQVKAKFDNGDVDWLGDPLAPSLPSKDDCCSVPIPAVRCVACNVQTPLLSSREVRLALSLAINRSRLSQNGERPSSSILPHRHSSLTNPTPLRCDIVQAHTLFRQGCYTLSISPSSLPALRCIVRDLPEDRRMAEAVVLAWEELFGLEIQLDVIPRMDFCHAISTSPYDLAMTVWHSISTHSVLAFEPWTQELMNPSRWAHEPFTNLIHQAAHVTNEEHRQQYRQAAEQLFLERMPCIPLVDVSLQLRTRPSFPPFGISLFGTVDFLRT